MNHRQRRRWLGVAVAAATLLLAFIAAEIATRLVDGYRVLAVRLVPLPSAEGVDRQFRGKWVNPRQAATYVASLPVANGVDRDWFWLSPPAPPPTPFDPDLVEQMKENPLASLQSVYAWNRLYARRTNCQDVERRDAVFANIGRLFVFDGPPGDPYPSFRFLSNAHYPTGLRTNAFGWRGADVPLNKPPRTVRLAFVGASTTVGAHGEPWSYPELVGEWLNEWARARGLDVRFEAINAGREGINSHSIAAVVEQELVPVEPDLVVYYEGSNQFWPDAFVREAIRTRSIQPFTPPRFFGDEYLALSHRLHALIAIASGEGREAPKPPLTVEWPKDLSETDPNLDDPRLPVNLPDILHDLDRAHAAAAAAGGELAIASFMWLVYDGMVLNRARDAMIYAYLNTPMSGSFGLFSYAHMRRYADFQNRVFEKYARVRGLPFIDYASAYPRDPRLFYDAIHMTTAGIRLQAWIMFQRLVPIVEDRLRSRRWPQPDRHADAVHPAFAHAGREMVATDALRAACGQ